MIAELKSKFKDATADNICITSREMIGYVSRTTTTPGLLTDASLLRLALGNRLLLAPEGQLDRGGG